MLLAVLGRQPLSLVVVICGLSTPFAPKMGQKSCFVRVVEWLISTFSFNVTQPCSAHDLDGASNVRY
jgi:hypothetical protein